ncbi:MAG TPA: hypothetical protein VE994_12085 [Terriglobales bacterium]|nr:hypothetical protein [Terriglobales bacterium]
MALGYEYRVQLAAAALMAVALTPWAQAVQLKPATVAAFDHYVQVTEKRMDGELQSGAFLWVDTLPEKERTEAYAQLKQGEIITRRMETVEHGKVLTAPDALIHHWMGTAFIPGVTLQQTIKLLHDFNDHTKYYQPEVVRSKLLQRQGDDFKVFYRLRKKKIVTVVLDTTYESQYHQLDAHRAYSNSYSTRIAEVENPGSAKEHEKPVGDDSGYMWRLNSYWRYWERDGGVYVQLEAISLTRDIPLGVGWMIRPFIESVPRESLMFTLSRTREALTGKKEAAGGE